MGRYGGAGVGQRAEQHVAADAGEAVEVAETHGERGSQAQADPSLSLSRNLTGNLCGWNELEVARGSLFFQPYDLVLTILGLVVFDAFVHVLLAEFQHAIEQPC